METRDSRYRIFSAIGQGGMGTVHLAQDTTLDRKVALKFLSPTHPGDASAHRRLLHEAQAAAHLDHPFICKVYEVGESDGRPFIAMEFLEGTTLKARLAEGPMPLAEALRAAIEMAEALDCAQTNAVVHRDLKPANVMLTRDGHVKVMDFGIAKRISYDTMGETLTATGGLPGTLAYMSPEQLRGQALDSRSDIFSFGLVLYEMLTGRHPFAGESAIGMAEAILNRPPPPLAGALPNAPALLEHVMERLLARDKEGRFQTFRDVRTELMSVAGAGRTTAIGPGPARRPWRRAAILLPVAVAVGALGIWRFAAWFNQPALAFNARDWIVIADVENLTGDPVFDRSLSMALNVSLSQSQYVNIIPQSRVREALQHLQHATADTLDEALTSEIAMREGAKAVVSCSIAQVGNVYSLTARLIDPQSRMPVLTESVRAAKKDDVLPALDRLGSEVRRRLGESMAALSRQHLPLPQATTASLDALKLYADGRRAPDPEAGRRLLEEAVRLDPNFAMAHAQLGASYYRESAQAQRLKGEEHLTKALSLVDRLSFRERLLIAALAADSRGNRDKAVVAYRAYLGAYPDDQDVWFRLGWTYMATLHECELAQNAFRRVIAINPRSASAFVNLATSLGGLGRDAEAREAYEHAFAVQPDLLLGQFVNNEYGFTLVRLGAVDRAAEVFGKMAAEIDPNRRYRGHRSLALLEMYRGHYRGASELFKQAIQIEQSVGADVSEFRDHLFLANSLRARGQARALEAEFGRIEILAARLALGPEWLRPAVKLFARGGSTSKAQKLVAVMAKNVGDPTNNSSANWNMQSDAAYLEGARGEIDLATGRASQAVQRLEGVYERVPTDDSALESLATACLAAGRVDEAARHYEKLIADRTLGSETQDDWFTAHVRLARIRQSQGDSTAARTLYQTVLSIWKDGDPDLLVLREAREGLASLK
jgi:tetratricopeptide (TPR) repeat protein/predicted Ser/Thr protein kinase